MRYVLLIGVLLIAGCNTTEKVIATAQADCAKFGFTPGSQEFAQCTQARVQHMEAITYGHSANSAAMTAVGAQILQNSQPRVLTPPPRMPITCTRSGAFVHCF